MSKSNNLNHYKIVNDNNRYLVVEIKTGIPIREFFSKRKAMEYATFLDNGAGFHGFTPSFIVRKVA